MSPNFRESLDQKARNVRLDKNFRNLKRKRLSIVTHGALFSVYL